jgi:hypothetical protein
MNRIVIALLFSGLALPASAQPHKHIVVKPQAAAAFAAVPQPRPAPSSALTPNAVQTNPLQLLQKFSVDDLNAALADAQAQNPPDDTAIQCYSALIPMVQSRPWNISTRAKGTRL